MGKCGSTIRIDAKKTHPSKYAMYFNCQTDLIPTFRTLFPTEFTFEGQRAIVFDVAKPFPKDALAFCITAALTYHLAKDTRRAEPTATSAGTHDRSHRV